MNIQLALKIDSIFQNNQNIFVKTNPEGIDFTNNTLVEVEFITVNDSVSIPLERENLLDLVTLIKTAAKLYNRSLICWNIKNLFSFVLSKTGIDFEFSNKILDLKVAESFIGIKGKCPASYDEMIRRMKAVIGDSSWNKFKNIHQKIYLPLITKVIPNIEVSGLFNSEAKSIVFSHYEVEGQVNGRMCCQLPSSNYFNPHSLSDEEKSKLRPRDQNLSFVSFDYGYMEVCMLAWLSQDRKLADLVNSDEDFYKVFFKLATGLECDTDAKRSISKRLFLPIVYGQTQKSAAEKLGISLKNIEIIFKKLKTLFPVMFDWVENYPNKGFYEDYVGRKRTFEEAEQYKYRNFIIQSPSAIFCLEKLVKLSFVAKSIVTNVHDSYTVLAEDKQVETVKNSCIKCLEEESDIFPGLKIKVASKISKTLS